jgi:hypothetical protein
MLNLNGSITLGTDIYVYPDFVSKEECEKIVNCIKSIPESDWTPRFNEAGQGHETSHVSISEIELINQRLKDILDEGVYLGDSISPTRMKRGTIGTHHSDNFDFLKTIEASSTLKDHEDFELAENNIAGLIMYFNDFEGGELYYSNQDVIYHPKSGDLVLHSSGLHCKHQVQEIKSEVRYSHSSNLFNFIKVPKGFKNDV